MRAQAFVRCRRTVACVRALFFVCLYHERHAAVHRLREKGREGPGARDLYEPPRAGMRCPPGGAGGRKELGKLHELAGERLYGLFLLQEATHVQHLVDAHDHEQGHRGDAEPLDAVVCRLCACGRPQSARAVVAETSASGRRGASRARTARPHRPVPLVLRRAVSRPIK